MCSGVSHGYLKRKFDAGRQVETRGELRHAFLTFRFYPMHGVVDGRGDQIFQYKRNRYLYGKQPMPVR